MKGDILTSRSVHLSLLYATWPGLRVRSGLKEIQEPVEQ